MLRIRNSSVSLKLVKRNILVWGPPLRGSMPTAWDEVLRLKAGNVDPTVGELLTEVKASVSSSPMRTHASTAVRDAFLELAVERAKLCNNLLLTGYCKCRAHCTYSLIPIFRFR